MKKRNIGKNIWNVLKIFLRSLWLYYVTAPVVTTDTLLSRLQQLILCDGWQFRVDFIVNQEIIIKDFNYGIMKVIKNSDSIGLFKPMDSLCA